MNLYQQIKDKFIDKTLCGKGRRGIYYAFSAKAVFERKAIDGVLSQLEKDGVIFFDGEVYKLMEDSGLIKGTLKGNEKGYAFLIAEDKSIPDCFIPHRKLNGAYHKDTVLVKLLDESRGESDEAEVVKILSRGVTSLCGTYFAENTFGFVRPDDKNYFTDIFVPFKKSLNAKSGDKVYVEITSFPKGNNPEGQIREILGRRYDLLSEENSIIKGYGFSEKFPPKVEAEVQKIPQEVEDNQLIGRLNLIDDLIITIDGEHSRDFDDAVSVTKNQNGNYVLGVHIADVTEYVKQGGAIDKEALRRSNSVYFPDRVIPMLPKQLSNGICSLNEGVIRLTLSCIMEIDQKGDIVDKVLQKSAIKSKRRMTYSDVQAILDGDKKLQKEYKDITQMLFLMEELRQILAKKRDERGNINLEVDEAEISFDGQNIDVKQRNDVTAYGIIEQFMVAANEAVAEYAFFTEAPFVYRVHEKPNEEKAQNFIDYLRALGINVRWHADNCYSKDFSSLLEKLSGEPIYPLVNRVMLRSMQKACYSTENKGHFGLASSCYCHFTSPIRRYPDLIIHRVLKDLLDGKIGELNDLYGHLVQITAETSSENEKISDEAERAVDDLYKVKYMSNFIGQEFDAVISGVTAFGIFSRLDNTIEGITKLEDLPRGRYVFDQKTYTLSCPKHSFKLGERVRVGVMNADISSRRVEFIILSKIYE